MKAVIVDMSNPRRIRLLGVSTGKNRRLLWHETREVDEGETVTWSLVKELLEEKSALTWPLCWMPSREQVGSAVLNLPPIPKREIAKVLPREVALATEASQELATSFMMGDRVEEKGLVKQEVTAAYMPRSVLYGALDEMRAAGLTPRWVLPEMAGHLQLLEGLRRSLKEPLSGTVMFELGASRIAMTIYRGVSWGLERVFTYRHEEAGEIGEEELSRISVELNRTLQFFKQRFRRVNVDRLVMYGENAYQNQVMEHIRTNHALHVIPADQAAFIERIDLGVSGDASREILSSDLVPLHLLPLLDGRSDLDLFPLGYLERDRVRSRVIGFGISYAVVFALLLVASFYFLGIRGDYRKQIETLRQTVKHQEAQNGQMVQTRNRRNLFYQWEYFRLWPGRYTRMCTDLIRQLTLMVNPEIHLTELVVDPGAHGAAFVLKGYISVADSIAAQSIFLTFFDQIRDLPYMTTLDSANVKVNAAKEGSQPGYTAESLSGRSTVELYFSINGEMEWP
jgi:hypothetical protein